MCIRDSRTEGFLICGLGAVAGMTLGVAATLAQQYFGLIEIPAETFLTKSYPVEFRPTDLAVVAASFAAVAALLSNITVRSMIKTCLLYTSVRPTSSSTGS